MIEGSDGVLIEGGFNNDGGVVGGLYPGGLGSTNLIFESGIVGGGSKTMSRQRRKVSKRLRKMTKKAMKSMKEIRKKRLKQKKKHSKFHKQIISSIESNKPISSDSFKDLSPSVRKFLEGIETKSNTLQFSDYKGKNLIKKGKSRTRGGNHHETTRKKKKKRSKKRGGNWKDKKTRKRK